MYESQHCPAYITDLTISLPAHLDNNKGPKWDPRRWPSIAALYKLVLTGWGPDLPTLPTEDWVDKSQGALTRAQWMGLVSRIPEEYHNNPFHSVPDDELPLEIITLDEFLDAHNGMACFVVSFCY